MRHKLRCIALIVLPWTGVVIVLLVFPVAHYNIGVLKVEVVRFVVSKSN
jgi:hypothetical protein